MRINTVKIKYIFNPFIPLKIHKTSIESIILNEIILFYYDFNSIISDELTSVNRNFSIRHDNTNRFVLQTIKNII